MKNKIHKEKLFNLFRGVSIMKGQDIPIERLELYVEFFSTYDYKKVDYAVFKAVSENKFFPDISEIMAHLAVKEPDSKQKASEIADDILMAVKEFGFYGLEDIRKKLSPIAYRVLYSIGLRNICHSENEGMMRAQIKNLAETLIEKEKYNPKECDWLNSNINKSIEYNKGEQEEVNALKKFNFEKIYNFKQHN